MHVGVDFQGHIHILMIRRRSRPGVRSHGDSRERQTELEPSELGTVAALFCLHAGNPGLHVSHGAGDIL